MPAERFNLAFERAFKAFADKDPAAFSQAIIDAQTALDGFPEAIELLEKACAAFPDCKALVYLTFAGENFVFVSQQTRTPTASNDDKLAEARRILESKRGRPEPETGLD